MVPAEVETVESLDSLCKQPTRALITSRWDTNISVKLKMSQIWRLPQCLMKENRSEIKPCFMECCRALTSKGPTSRRWAYSGRAVKA